MSGKEDKDSWGYQGGYPGGNQHGHHGHNHGNQGNQGWGNQGNQAWDNQGNQGWGNQGNQGWGNKGNQGNQGWGNQGNQGNQGWGNQGNQGGAFGNIGIAAFQHMTGGNFGKFGASYSIRSSLGRVLDVSQSSDYNTNAGDTIIYDFWGGKNQRFTIANEGEDLIIRCVNDDKAIEVVPGGPNTKGRVRAAPYNGSANQRWRIRKADNSSSRYFLINVGDGKCLDV